MFRTPINLTPVSPQMSLEQPLLSMGSCFADVMGERLRNHKFHILSNPFGVLYHPLAIFNVLEKAQKQEMPLESSYLCHQGIYYNYNLHSQLAHSSLEKLQGTIALRNSQTKKQLDQRPVLILTFGTAYQYQLKASGTRVANCHKQPADLFERHCSTVSEIVESFSTLHQMLKVSQTLISVSPVRHIKDGLIENSYSKSVLRVACQEIVDTFSDTQYFPGYEMVTDDLRDYRFYGKDMIHPNEVAHDYIWELFVRNYLDESSQRFIEQWEKITKNLKHKAFHQDSEGHQKFLRNTLSMLEQVPTHIDVREEIQTIKAQMI